MICAARASIWGLNWAIGSGGGCCPCICPCCCIIWDCCCIICICSGGIWDITSCCACASANRPICSCMWPCRAIIAFGLSCMAGVDITAMWASMWASWAWSGKACKGAPCKANWFSFEGFIGGGGGGGGGKMPSMLFTPSASYILRYAWYNPCGPPCICGLDWTNCNSVCAKAMRWDIEKMLGSETGKTSTRESKSCENISGPIWASAG